MKAINAVRVGGAEVLPLVEGGKGVSVSTGVSAGAWAAAGGVGTISVVNADSYDEHGNVVPQIYKGRTRRERQEELIDYAIKGCPLYTSDAADDLTLAGLGGIGVP